MFPSRWRGFSMTGFIFVMGVVGFFAFLGMRLGPVYLEHHSIVTAMKQTAQEPGAKGQSLAQLRKSLEKRFMVGYVEAVKAAQFTLKDQPGGRALYIKYEVRNDLMYNLEFVATFEHSETLQ